MLAWPAHAFCPVVNYQQRQTSRKSPPLFPGSCGRIRKRSILSHSLQPPLWLNLSFPCYRTKHGLLRGGPEVASAHTSRQQVKPMVLVFFKDDFAFSRFRDAAEYGGFGVSFLRNKRDGCTKRTQGLSRFPACLLAATLSCWWQTAVVGSEPTSGWRPGVPSKAET